MKRVPLRPTTNRTCVALTAAQSLTVAYLTLDAYEVGTQPLGPTITLAGSDFPNMYNRVPERR